MGVRVKKRETWKGKHRDITASRVSTEDRSEEEVVIELKALCNVIKMYITNPQEEELWNKLYEELNETPEFLVLKMDNDIREKYKERMEEEAKTREYNLLGDIHTKGLVALAKAVVEVIQLLQEIRLEDSADSLKKLAQELIELELAFLLEKWKKTRQEVLNKLGDDKAKKGAQLEQLQKDINEKKNRVAELEKQIEELLNLFQEVQKIVKELKEWEELLLKLQSQDTSISINYVRSETGNTMMQSNSISRFSINLRGGYYSSVNAFEIVSRSNESLVPGGNLKNGNDSSNTIKQAVGYGAEVKHKGRLTVEVVREDNGEGVQGVEVEINGEVSRTDQRGVVVKEVDYGSKVRVVVRDTRVGDVVYVVERWEVEGGRAVCEGNACTLEVSGNVELRAYVKITLSLEPLYEFPELFTLVGKLVEEKPLDETDEAILRELVGATGWDEADLREELARLGEDPSESIERYKELFEKYSREAVDLFSRGDTRQAAEKMWGAVLALVKLYAAIKGVFVAHWSRSKIDSVIASNVEPEYRKLFRELVDRAHVLHEHFYEGSLHEELFRERWDETLELLEEAREVVYKRLPQ
ncbi:MAG: PaREP1 family protein [Candidatus Hadarchaeum sp.]|uniref:Uncharacterized protein n=1 Tax=Thermofilum adornatum 1505 TaxID=697581 RepID=A0A3G1A4X5_9CREN|nr:PaREP1 family protein [Thermofilum adornatum]AJB41749.1 hypothetical protein TCARB_0693 [Thermofilum adornatum 1505]